LAINSSQVEGGSVIVGTITAFHILENNKHSF
jgi:hypothetical protein